jgi:hypothetical protein
VTARVFVELPQIVMHDKTQLAAMLSLSGS